MFSRDFHFFWTSLVAQTVKCLLTMRETWVQSLGREDLLEKEMATHSSILAWKIPWTKEPDRLQSMGLQRVGHKLATEQQFVKILYFFSICGGYIFFPLANVIYSICIQIFPLSEKQTHSCCS